jgi:hypothetical protein
MRAPPPEADSEGMTSAAPPTADPPTPGDSAPASAGPGRLRAAPVVALAFTLVLAFLVVSVSYGITREYGDTSASDLAVAGRALRDWALGVVLVAGLAALVVVTARRSRMRRALTTAAALAVTVTLLAVPAVAVIGVHQKLDAYPQVPRCTAGFTGGPAVPVVRAAQAAFDELEHPGPFSGGGESGIDGCASQLMVDADVDVATAYSDALRATGWQLGRVEPERVEATRDGQRFTASRDRHDAWWVRIGPADPVR